MKLELGHSLTVMGSGCSHHMTPTCNNYTFYNAYTTLQTIQLADKSHINAIGEGTMEISTVVDGMTCQCQGKGPFQCGQGQ